MITETELANINHRLIQAIQTVDKESVEQIMEELALLIKEMGPVVIEYRCVMYNGDRIIFESYFPQPPIVISVNDDPHHELIKIYQVFFDEYITKKNVWIHIKKYENMTVEERKWRDEGCFYVGDRF